MAPTTRALLAEVGAQAGSSCLDLGCGGGHFSRYFSELVGLTGRVVGLDRDTVKLGAAQDDCDRAAIAMRISTRQRGEVD